MTYRVGFLVSGRARLFQAATTARDVLGFEPALVLADGSAAENLKEFCVGARVPLIRLPEAPAGLESTLLDASRAYRPDLLMLTFDRVVPPSVIAAHPGRVLNTHPSLLPAFRGFHPIERALSTGVRFAGATIHVATNYVDRGSILAQCMVPVVPTDDVESLGGRLFPHLRSMYLQTIAWHVEGRVYVDRLGRYLVVDGRYGEEPVSPAIESRVAKLGWQSGDPLI